MFTDDANTSALGDFTVIIPEGHNGTISCRSVGAPVPTIIWKFNNQTSVFSQTDVLTSYQVSVSDAGNNTLDLSPGNIESTLHIVNALYPDNNGHYVCFGTNANDLEAKSSSDFIVLQVNGELHKSSC